MKKFEVTLLPKGHPDSVGYINKALKAIKEHPYAHGYSESEVQRLKKIEDDFNKSVKPNTAIQQFIDLQNKMRIAIDGIGSILGGYAKELKHLSAKGWYISPNIIYDYNIDELAEKVRKENAEMLEKEIIGNNRDIKSVRAIIQSCKKVFPNRSKLFDEISKLYEQELFASVVSVCYNQADGMCNDVWGIGFFDKKKDENKNHKIKLYDELHKDDFGVSTYFINQLGYPDNEMTMWVKHDYFSDDDIKKSSFNRHLIIHGHSTEYGTEVNALRAILLLDFINYFANLSKNIEK